MTQVRRPLVRSSPVRVLRVAAILAVLILISVALFELDAFPRRKRLQGRRPVGTSSVVAAPITDPLAVPPLDAGPPPLAAEKVQDAASTITAGRTLVMELANLQQGQTGRVLIQTHPEWAPLGVEHFHQLVDAHFYDQTRFFRVLPNFVVQWGIAADPAVQETWAGRTLRDDPVTQSNVRARITFATSGPSSRTTQLFINKADNHFLDAQGFSPLAEIVQGMEFIDQIVDKYRETPNQGKIVRQGNTYLQQFYPELSYIVTIREAIPADTA